METNIPWVNSFTNKNLEFIILVTEQCNFRCTYCYEDFKIGKIAPDVIKGLKNLIAKRMSEIKTLNLSFFGGEPLLNREAIFEISNYAVELFKESEVKYFAGITTNGYSLDNEIFKKLIQSEVRNYQITIDGEKDYHDKLRPTLGGKCTFNKIYSNLIMMGDSSCTFSCTIRFNIADSNFNSVKSFIRNYSIPFKNDDRFTFHFHPIFGMPELKLTKEEQLNELKELAEAQGFKYDVPSEHGLCYAARADSFVIRADGRVQKCTVALESEINNIGNIYSDGTLKIDQAKFKKWILADNKACPVQSLTLDLVLDIEG